MTPHPDRFARFLERGWWLPLAVALGWLALAWTAAIAIDIHNVGGMQDWMLERYPQFPLAWYHLFSEAQPTEWLQWTLQGVGLAVAVVVWRRLSRQEGGAAPAPGGIESKVHTGAKVTAGVAPRGDATIRTGWFLLAAGLFMMLMEDSQNVRHLVSDSYLIPLFEPRGVSSRSVRLVWELSFYAFLAALMGGGLLLVLRRVWPDRRTLAFLFAGYGLYGLVGFGSAARRVLDWQERLGNWAIERWSLLEIRTWAEAERQLAGSREVVPGFDHTLSYMITDHWIEESIELLSAGVLVTALLLLAQRVRWDSGVLGDAAVRPASFAPLAPPSAAPARPEAR